MIAWVNGAWVKGGAPALAASDRGFTLGDGLFETIYYDGAALRRFSRHRARLCTSTCALGLPAPPSGLDSLCLDVLTKNDLRHAPASVRVTWTSGAGARGLARPEPMAPTLVITAAPFARDAAPASIVTARVRREDGVTARHKTLSYIANVMAMREAGANEAVLLNRSGLLAGGARCNVVCVIDGALRTPAVAHGALPGTVRAAMLDAPLDVRVSAIGAGEIARIEAAAITNALQGVRRVSRWDGRALGAHPLIERLVEAEPALV